MFPDHPDKIVVPLKNDNTYEKLSQVFFMFFNFNTLKVEKGPKCQKCQNRGQPLAIFLSVEKFPFGVNTFLRGNSYICITVDVISISSNIFAILEK